MFCVNTRVSHAQRQQSARLSPFLGGQVVLTTGEKRTQHTTLEHHHATFINTHQSKDKTIIMENKAAHITVKS